MLCQSYASMSWCLVTDIDYVTLDYLHSRVLTEPSFVSAMVDGILCMHRTVVDSVPKPSAENRPKSAWICPTKDGKLCYANHMRQCYGV